MEGTQLSSLEKCSLCIVFLTLYIFYLSCLSVVKVRSVGNTQFSKVGGLWGRLVYTGQQPPGTLSPLCCDRSHSWGAVGSLLGSVGLSSCSKGAAQDGPQRHFCEIRSPVSLTLPL